MMPERWDVLDKNGIPTGKTVFRGAKTLSKNEYHLVVHIWVVSQSGKILIQRRSKHKKLMPGEWAATGGAAVAGEDSFTAASRELFEELSIKTSPKTLKQMLRIKRRNSLLDVWFTQFDADITSLKLQASEVAEVKWVTLGELKQMIEKSLFHNYGHEYFKNVFQKIEEFRGAMV